MFALTTQRFGKSSTASFPHTRNVERTPAVADQNRTRYLLTGSRQSDSRQAHRHRILLQLFLIGVLVLCAAAPACAGQQDIPGPADSVYFGTQALVLPNGNIVVTDPAAVSGLGAVWLYDPEGVMISEVTGSSANDHIGNVGVTVLSNGNFVIRSIDWQNGSASNAGAVTWVSATTGLNGVISSSNSLVGSSANDAVGSGVITLSNGNYVVNSASWNNGSIAHAGAVTLCDGAFGCTAGAVSASNSLVGSTTGDTVGSDGVTALNNGNYVVSSSQWNNGVADAHVGAVTGAAALSGSKAPLRKPTRLSARRLPTGSVRAP